VAASTLNRACISMNLFRESRLFRALAPFDILEVKLCLAKDRLNGRLFIILKVIPSIIARLASMRGPADEPIVVTLIILLIS
jgi:hypothetical protein